MRALVPVPGFAVVNSQEWKKDRTPNQWSPIFLQAAASRLLCDARVLGPLGLRDLSRL